MPPTPTALLFLAACSIPVVAPVEDPVAPADPPAVARDLRASLGAPVQLRIRDLDLQVDGGEIWISYLRGRLVPGGDYVDLDDPTSFTVEVDALELRIPAQSLQLALQPDGDASPVRSVTLRTEGAAFVLEGHTRLLGLPFLFRADPAVVDGDLVLQLEKVRILGVGIRGFLNAFAGPVEDAVNKKPRRKLLTVGDDRLVLDPFPFAGPPLVHAAFTSVEVRPDGLVARLGDPPSPDSAASGLTLTGGALRTGATLMFSSTLALVAQEGDGPLVLDPGKLTDQIEGGFAKLHGDVVTLHLAPPDTKAR